MTPADVDELEALEKAATVGPWKVSTTQENNLEVRTTSAGHGYLDVCAITPWLGHHEQNAALIVALRNAAPALIAAARKRYHLWDSIVKRAHERDALVAEVDRLRTVIDETASIMDDHEGPLPTCAAMARDKLRAALKVNS